MTNKSKAIIGVAFVATLLTLGIGQSVLQQQAVAQEGAKTMAPYFEVDPFWPKPLPNHWITGNAIGVAVDQRDHVFIVHRDQDEIFLSGGREIGLKTGVSECCTPAPPILEFDPAGNLVNSWGGPGEGYTWPASNHGIEIAPNGDIWIGGNGAGDSHVLVFSRDGKFLKQIGEPGNNADSNSTKHFAQVAEIAIDVPANEAYIADGYRNKRVAVLDLKSGDFKRFWGAYGNKPEDGRVDYKPGEELPKQFRGPVHCAEPSKDGLVYVCDRGADRIQVFKKDGTYVTEKQILPNTLVQGSVWDIAFSKDADQKYIYVADGQNHRVHILDRKSLDILTTFGDGGRGPGLFFAVHSIVTDSKGNIYTTETYDGRRLQKFNYKGERAVTSANSGPAWPADKL
jgi:DNA-binding beta-propeller fold protein YncE